MAQEPNADRGRRAPPRRRGGLRPPWRPRPATPNAGEASTSLPSPAVAGGLTDSSRERAFRQLASVLDGLSFRRVHLLVLALVAFGTLINAIEEYDVGLAAPLLKRQWGLSSTRVGLLTTVTFAGMAIGSLVAGAIGDRHGRRKTYLYNLAIYTVGAPLAALSPSFGWLLCARFIVGLGLGGELNVGLTLVAELMPTRHRGAAVAAVNVAGGGLGILASSALAALMLGPLEGALGGSALAWRWLLGILALPALLLYLYRRTLPESPRYLLARGRVEQANDVLTRLVSNRLRPIRGMRPTCYVTAPPDTPAARQRITFGAIFGRQLVRNTTVLWVVCAMTFGAQVTVTVFLPALLVARGLDVEKSLAYATIINVGGLAGALVASAFGHALKRRVVLGYGSAVAVVVALALWRSTSLEAEICLATLLQLMFLLLNTTTFIWAPELYPTPLRAFGTGAAVTVLLVAASVFPLVGGFVDDAVGTPGDFLLVAGMYLIMSVAVWFGSETHGRPLEESAGIAVRSRAPSEGSAL